jgi:hypothetical protein
MLVRSLMDELDSGNDDAHSVLKPLLNQGESLVWVGRPSLRRFRWEIAAEIFIGVCLVAIGLAELTVFGFVMVTKGAPPATWIGVAGGLGFAIMGIYCTLAPIRYRRILTNAIYAVTTERAMMVNGFGYARRANLCVLDEPDRSFPFAIVRGREVKRRRRDGSGDIVFDSALKRGRRGHYRVGIGFFGVTSVDQVDALLNTVKYAPMKFDLESI